MKLQAHMISSIPVFAIESPREDVVKFFKESAYSHIALTEEDRFLGMLAESDLAAQVPGGSLEDYRYTLEAFFSLPEASWLDVLEIFSRNDANLIPVLDEKRAVSGYYDLIDILGLMVETPFFNESGSVLVVAKGVKDHSFSEIVQIVESNNTSLLGAFISDVDDNVVQTTIKINSSHLNEVVQTFRRYNYNILYGNTDDQFLEDLKQRSDYLDKYLNV